MDEKVDGLIRSKYFSLGCALLNLFFAITSAVSGNFLFFIICGIFGAICFRNYLEAR